MSGSGQLGSGMITAALTPHDNHLGLQTADVRRPGWPLHRRGARDLVDRQRSGQVEKRSAVRRLTLDPGVVAQKNVLPPWRPVPSPRSTDAPVRTAVQNAQAWRRHPATGLLLSVGLP